MDKETINVLVIFLIASAVIFLAPQVYQLMSVGFNAFTLAEIFGSALLYVTMGLWLYFSNEKQRT